MLLTTELDKLSGTDWQLFFAQERAKPYFAELDAFVTAAAAEKTVYPAAENIFAAFRACTGKPTAILMHTTKGKGVSYMENSVDWHGKAPNDAEYEVAMGELRAAMAELEA